MAAEPPPDVFLSYAREDERRAGELAEGLGNEGYVVFWDRRVPPGETWHSYIGQALTAAKCVVVVWSSSSIKSDFVIEEAQSGKNRHVLIPVRIERVEPPFGFGLIHAADLTDWDLQGTSEAFQYLLNSIRNKVDPLWTHRTESSERAFSQRLARPLAPERRRVEEEGPRHRTEEDARRRAGQAKRTDQSSAHHPIRIFISYSHKDERLRDKLSAHLALLKRGRVIDEWHDRRIGAGQEWAGTIDEHLNTAAVILLLVTPDFLASDYCYDLEMKRALERHDAGDAQVVPVILRPVDWHGAPFAKLQALPKNGKPVTSWSKRDEAFADVARGIRTVVDEIRRRPTPSGQDALSSKPVIPTSAPRWPAQGPLTPGTVFRDVDAPWCPELVVIPPGEFMMGSPEGEEERYQDEGPQHLVTIGYTLAVGRYPVTFDEYDLFAGSTGRRQPGDQGWSRKRRPVIDVSWDDAKAYVEWLASDTGQAYRLLSEAEWEYACRARTTARYWWGEEITPKNANYGESVGETTEVGSYPANRWGLCDMHGNVWEWVEDCWNDSYNGVPDDGGPWTSDDCSRRVLRGGSWYDHSRNLRSACRNRLDTGNRDNTTGFRVARALSGQPAVSSAKGAHGGDLKYHDPALSGQVTFNYSNNDGRYSIGRNEFFFETMWSKANDRSIHLYNDPPSIAGVAEAPKLQGYGEVRDPTSYDMSSRARTIEEGEHAILKNRHNKYAVLKVLDIKDRTRSDSVDELTFKFWILTDTS